MRGMYSEQGKYQIIPYNASMHGHVLKAKINRGPTKCTDSTIYAVGLKSPVTNPHNLDHRQPDPRFLYTDDT